MSDYELQAQGFKANECINFQGNGDLIIPEETAQEMVRGCQEYIDKGQLIVYQLDSDPNPRLTDAVAKVDKVLLQSGWIYVAITLVDTPGGKVLSSFFKNEMASVWPAVTRGEISGGNPPVLFRGNITHFIADINNREGNKIIVGSEAAKLLADFDLCNECAGSGKSGKPNEEKCKCTYCGGSGFESVLCDKCAGTGRHNVFQRTVPCTYCTATGRVPVRITTR